MFSARNIILVVIAGIVGTIANSIIIVALRPDAALLPLVLSFGRNLVAIIVALLLIPIFASMDRAPAWITALVALTVIPSLLAKFAFGAAAPWGFVLGVNFVYALAATLVYAIGRRT